ncbi:MAG: GAF domain-containing protein, partial [Aurantibacter sp.]
MNKAAFIESALKLKTFPFKTQLSFESIIKHWESFALEGSVEEQNYARSVLEEMDKTPAFRKPIKNHKAFVKKHRTMVDKLLSAIFPPALKYNEIKAVTPPFLFDVIGTSPRFQKIMENNGGILGDPCNLDPKLMDYAKYIHTCLMLLAKYYKRVLPLETPFIFQMKDPATGLDMYYKMTINADFINVKVKGKLKELSEKEIDQMVENFHDIELWQKNLPPKNFEINGLVVCTLVNVTLNELLSHLKNYLLEPDALLTESQFEKIRHNLRGLFKIPDLKVGLGVFRDDFGISNFGHWSWRDLVCKGKIKNIANEFKGSIYQKVQETGEVVIVESLDDIDNPTGIECAIKEASISSIIVAPLKYKDEIIGYLELGSSVSKVLNPVSMARVDDILPLFSVAIQRSVEERSNRIDAVIMEQFTAIHSSVQWRFEKAARHYLKAKDQELEDVEMEPIVFEDVYPLYGMADIRDSSVHRNLAIQADLITQLELAQKIVIKVSKIKELPILQEMNFRIDKLMDSIGKKLRSQDETRVFQIMNREIEPFFEYALKEFPSVKKEIDRYRSKLDQKLGVVYKRRKSYEESVTRINSTLSEFLEEKEKDAQAMYPHYFEKYKTDGVDYNIYVGKSLLKNGVFNSMCLSNIRLWQFIMMAEMTKVTT